MLLGDSHIWQKIELSPLPKMPSYFLEIINKISENQCMKTSEKEVQVNDHE